MIHVYSHHLRCLPPAEELQREPEQFWTVPRALILAAFAAMVITHHISWSAKL